MYHGHSSSFQYWHPNKLIIKEHTCIAVPHREKQSRPNEKKHLDLMLETISLSHYRTNYRSERAVNTEEMNKKLQSWHTGCYMFGYSIVARFTHLTQGCVYPDLFLNGEAHRDIYSQKFLYLNFTTIIFIATVALVLLWQYRRYKSFPNTVPPLLYITNEFRNVKKPLFFSIYFLDRIV